MATFRKRGNKWHVQVRRAGHPALTRSFFYKSDAEAWARQTERQIDDGDLNLDRSVLRSLTVTDLLDRYCREVLPRKRSRHVEQYVLNQLSRSPLGQVRLDLLSPELITRYRDDRLRKVKPGTVHRELAVFRHCLEIARTDWGIPLKVNPVAQIKMPKPSAARSRRLAEGELTALIDGSAHHLLSTIIQFAVETGMRRGEIVNAKWKDFDQEAGTLHIPITKNGCSRTIPLTQTAIDILGSTPREDERIFPISGNAIRLAWERLKKQLKIDDLRFHDLRHEAISRFFEMGLSVPEVALISGHKDPRMLFRYTHLRAEDVALKLRG